jgi:RpiB/LacA/LacB family sugar-phosphate isomerase
MNIYIGADHRGHTLKEYIETFLKNQGYSVVDLGSKELVKDDDYPDVAAAVGEHVSREYEISRGVLVCGSGVGVSIVANKFPRVRAALVLTPDQAFDSRSDDNANVLALASDYTDITQAKKILEIWLTTPFSREERHERRVNKISQVEARLVQEAVEAERIED